jgi:ketosteroid isomerase-like protein
VSETNVEIVRRGYEAVRRGDLETLGEFLDPMVRWHGGDPDAEGACANRVQALEFVRRARARGRLGELVEVAAAGDRVVVVMRSGPRDADPPALTANVTTLRDGKAVEIVHYPSPDDAFAAVGLTAPRSL